MRRTASGVVVLGLFFGFTLPGRAGDEASDIIDKAVKAHFPKGIDTKNQGIRMKSKGTLHIAGQDLEYSQEVAVQSPDKFKESMDMTVMTQKVNVTSVYNGKEAWIRAGDQDVKVTDEILKEFKEAAYALRLIQGTFLKDKSVTYSLLGETKVKDKPAVGVTVSGKGHRDINLFFDKQTGLIVKVEARKLDFQSGREVTEERIITEYQDVDGRKVAKKVEVLRDGKPFLEAEVTEAKIVEKVEDSEFAQPK